MKRLLLIDGMNMFIRNYVMSPQLDGNGNPIGGVTGFLRSLQKEVRNAKPDKVVVAWEGPGGSQRRKEKNKNYKAGRKPPRLNREYEFATPEAERENKYEQLMRLTEYLDQIPILQMSLEHVEADDVIAWLCNSNEYKDWQKLIISSDRDFIQLCDDRTILLRPGKHGEVLNRKSVIDNYGIHPRNFAVARAIAGDKSDNLPGVPGLGLKTVAKRFPFLSEEQDYTIPEVLHHAKENKNNLKIFQKVLDNEDIISENYDIMQLYTSTISAQGISKLKYAIENDGRNFDRIEIKRLLARDGIPTLHLEDLLLAVKSH